jgi:hypothetical protein
MLCDSAMYPFPKNAVFVSYLEEVVRLIEKAARAVGIGN